MMQMAAPAANLACADILHAKIRPSSSIEDLQDDLFPIYWELMGNLDV